MVEPFGILADGLDDLGVTVTKHGAHLAGREIQDGTAVGIIDEGSGGALDDDRSERSAIPNEVTPRTIPKGFAVISRHARFLCCRGAAFQILAAHSTRAPPQ